MGRGARSIVLILAEAEDASAPSLADGLDAHGLSIELATPAQLCAGAIEHRLKDGSATFRIGLQDGGVLDALDVGGVVNRMLRIPLSVLGRSERADRSYVEAEWRALLCSLLRAVPGRVIDPPHPHSLSGRWRSPPEWLALARRAGFRTPEWLWNDHAPAPTTTLDTEAERARVLVVGGCAVSVGPTPRQAADACRRLAALAGVSVLEVGLVGGEPRTFGYANHVPDLREFGDEAIAAFARLLPT